MLALGNAAARKRKPIHSGDPVAHALPLHHVRGLDWDGGGQVYFEPFVNRAAVLLVLISRALQRLRGLGGVLSQHCGFL